MYLSRVEIATNDRQKTKELTHLGAYHNWVEQSFPDEIKSGERRRHLWRVDQLNGKNYLLVLSEEKPSLKQFESYGVDGTGIVKSYDEFLDSVHVGDIMRFRLTANPSYAAYTPGAKRGRIYPHVTVEQQRKWLNARSASAGFKLVKNHNGNEDEENYAFDIVTRDHPTLYRKSGHNLRLSRVTFEGILQIQDLDAFKTTLIHGLGREKAFGMGLMTVIPEV